MTRRKSTEPACRVCACTEHNACDEGCSWVKVEPGSPPLCSACSGGVGDMAEAIGRGIKLLGGPRRPDRPLGGLSRLKIDQALVIGLAARRRRNARVKAEARNPDPAWGNR